ncbi:unnamed protein product [Sphagnum jensenii]|uniref:Protein phosphatase n=1 Tax=Sphagnum jensenii TaxID=128206 RepID=A0ABP1BF78_9BRYO
MRVSWERVPGTISTCAPPGSSSGSETSRPKSMSKTSFKVFSGASVSANTATPRSITSQEEFNSFSNILFDRASACKGTSSYPCSLSLADPFQILALSQALSPLEFPPQGPHWRGDSYQGKAGEDRVHVVLSEEHGWLFVGIYDGFNGPDAPDFLMSNLYTAIYQELKGLLWDQDDIGFDSFCPGGSPEEKEASGAVDFPSVVGSDVEGGDEIQWQQ